jgi:hypothetical protein
MRKTQNYLTTEFREVTLVEEGGGVAHGCGDEVELWKLHVGSDVHATPLRPPVDQVVVGVANYKGKGFKFKMVQRQSV